MAVDMHSVGPTRTEGDWVPGSQWQPSQPDAASVSTRNPSGENGLSAVGKTRLHISVLALCNIVRLHKLVSAVGPGAGPNRAQTLAGCPTNLIPGAHEDTCVVLAQAMHPHRLRDALALAGRAWALG